MSDYKVPSFEESFGSFGVNRMDLRVFDQDKFWVDRGGLPHLIANMSVDYLVNVLDFLEDNAAGFFTGVGRAILIDAFIAGNEDKEGALEGKYLEVYLWLVSLEDNPNEWVNVPEDFGSVFTIDVRGSLETFTELMRLTPLEWVKSTVLWTVLDGMLWDRDRDRHAARTLRDR